MPHRGVDLAQGLVDVVQGAVKMTFERDGALLRRAAG
jgi:hypothetical protein